MKVLMIGDVFGKPGRKTVAKVLPEIKEKNGVDLVVANAENIHHGKGISDAMIRELQSAGCDFFTSGNHVWKVAEIETFLDMEDYPLIRPANYPPGVPGSGYKVITVPGSEKKVAVINLMGRVYMQGSLDDPFRKADEILKELEENGWKLGETLAAILVDCHAEAGSEKMALAYYLDGRISALVGTHTHIQTSDERILNGGTGYLTDLGMVGVIDSVIGIDKNIIIEGFLKQKPVRHQVPEGDTSFGALLLDIDETNGLCNKVERIFISPITL